MRVGKSARFRAFGSLSSRYLLKQTLLGLEVGFLSGFAASAQWSNTARFNNLYQQPTEILLSLVNPKNAFFARVTSFQS